MEINQASDEVIVVGSALLVVQLLLILRLINFTLHCEAS